MGVDPRVVEQVVIHQLEKVIDPETGVVGYVGAESLNELLKES